MGPVQSHFHLNASLGLGICHLVLGGETAPVTMRELYSRKTVTRNKIQAHGRVFEAANSAVREPTQFRNSVRESPVSLGRGLWSRREKWLREGKRTARHSAHSLAGPGRLEGAPWASHCPVSPGPPLQALLAWWEQMCFLSCRPGPLVPAACSCQV